LGQKCSELKKAQEEIADNEKILKMKEQQLKDVNGMVQTHKQDGDGVQ
jgi:hypothetical protein